MTIKIISVGNKPSPELADSISNYTTRLPRTISVTWQYLKHADGDARSSKQQESESILRAIGPKDFVILLDEVGTHMTSTEFSEVLFTHGNSVVFVIGGAYGVSEAMQSRANIIWSLSKLVFPHQLVRLILSEQIYRAYTISIHHPYHHS